MYIEDEIKLRYPVDILNNLTVGSSLPENILHLKNYFVFMLLENLEKNLGHVNGAKYTVEDISLNFLLLRCVSEHNYAATLVIPRISCNMGDCNFPIPGFTRTRFPILVCFSIAKSKEQGQYFSGNFGLDLLLT